jgi:hypothetical protein
MYCGSVYIGARVRSVLILRRKMLRPWWLRAAAPAAFLVNAQVADIFKGIFETRNSTRNGKNIAKSGALGTCRAAVYH